jgi:hypothetical protein
MGVWFGFALHCAELLCAVCEVAASFVSGWQAFSFVSLCKIYRVVLFSPAACHWWRLRHSPASGSCARAAARLPGWAAVAYADLCGCVWSLSRVGLSHVACVCLSLASPL